ncbi:MAG: AMP-binding protein [Burkholderiales bacterium]|uniref:(2,3-dihydroxybenzoyl)adenylate synthase n=2 Tax=Ottowia TaxID=219181 RepID=A0ABV6PQM6_9BURK|nr:AMP-binding protein [Burkholderiales bacterium]MBS0404274.1 AMP-binding protein [Pseudomonadota bacterium]MBS0413789.1 AMP-binding protein [Pseudomonadota bacterium]
MQQGCVFWPKEAARHYRESGLWSGQTLWDMMAQSIARTPDKTALVSGELRLNYRALDEQSASLAAALLARGLQPLDRVVLHLPNGVEFILYYLALVRIGAIPVMALRAHRDTEIRHFTRASQAVAYIAPDAIRGFDYRALGQALRQEFAHLKHVVIVGQAGAGQISHEELVREGQAMTDRQLRLAAVRVDAEAVGTILLSGGTTSLPKLIPRTHQDYVLNARLCGAATGFNADTVFMPILPLAHNYNLCSPGILATFCYGGTVALCPSTETADIFQTVQQHGVTVIAAARPLVARWLDDASIGQYDLSSLKVVQNGGTRMPPEFRRRMMQELHVTPQEVYGTAEGLINMTPLNASEDILLNSSGEPVSEFDEIKIIDEEGNELPDGVAGELVTRGPYTICGYYDAPEVNASAFTPDGFYKMGDVVRKHGRTLYVEGRKKDVINRGGEKIDCEDVENILLLHPAVQTASLVAMPDKEFGEKACAFVVLKAGQPFSFADMVAHMKRIKVAAFNIPERLEVVDALPTSPVGKVLKRELRQIITDHLAREATGQ